MAGTNQDEVQRALLYGIFGPPELKRSERDHLLGEFAERVLAAITIDEVAEGPIDPRVKEAVQDERATAVIVHADVPYAEAAKYHRLAQEHGLDFTLRGDPSYEGDVGLVVVSDQAVR